MGSDIDYLMLHAKNRPSRISQKIREKDESIRANLRQYGCEQLYVDVLVSDFSNSIWNERITFDSIITDRKCWLIDGCVCKDPYRENNRRPVCRFHPLDILFFLNC